MLAIWNDCAPGSESRYEHWYRSEHLAERVAIPGFVAGWRYVAVAGSPRYFTHYETRTPAVLTSDAYRERVNDPTPLTREIMSGVFVNAVRTVCERVLCVGRSRGGFVAVLRFAVAPARERVAQRLASLAGDDAVLRAELWEAAVVSAEEASAEQQLRGPDGGIAACVVLETTDEAAAHAAAGQAAAALPPAAAVGVYRLMCSLHAEGQD